MSDPKEEPKTPVEQPPPLPPEPKEPDIVYYKESSASERSEGESLDEDRSR